MAEKTKRIEALVRSIVAAVEEKLGVSLDMAEVEDRAQGSLQVLVHELLHAGLSQALPEFADPLDQKADLVNEIVVRILEDELCGKLGIPIHSPAEHVNELTLSFPSFSLEVEEYCKLAEVWRAKFSPKRDLIGFGRYVLSSLPVWG